MEVVAVSDELRLEFTDRYGGHAPSLLVGCRGQCEAMGYVPISADEEEEPWRTLWLEAEAQTPAEDGWHFVRCPDCGGTGRARGWKRIGNFAWWLRSKGRFARLHVFVRPGAYADREDKGWWWNRKVALRVLTGRIR